MTRIHPAALVLSSLLVLAACGEAPERPAADFEGLAEGWNAIEPGGETSCSDGSPYRFFVRPGDPEQLLVYLEGGGACWNGGTCDPDLRPTYAVDVGDRHPSRAHGILAFDEAANPFRDHTVVYAPYCTGDVHLGAADTTYGAPETDEHPAHEVLVRHRGAVNVEAALAWTAERVFRPERIFVTGSSAGALPSPVYASALARRYPEAGVAQLGDGAGGYRLAQGSARPHEAWRTLDVLEGRPAFGAVTAEDFSFEALYTAAARAHPDVTFARYDTAEDSVQLRFLRLGGAETPSLQPLLEANNRDIRDAVDNVRTYIAGGGVHTILLRPEFYTFRVGDETVRDWVAALARGGAPEDVACTACAVAETAPRTTEDGGP